MSGGWWGTSRLPATTGPRSSRPAARPCGSTPRLWLATTDRAHGGDRDGQRRSRAARPPAGVGSGHPGATLRIVDGGHACSRCAGVVRASTHRGVPGEVADRAAAGRRSPSPPPSRAAEDDAEGDALAGADLAGAVTVRHVVHTAAASTGRRRWGTRPPPAFQPHRRCAALRAGSLLGQHELTAGVVDIRRRQPDDDLEREGNLAVAILVQRVVPTGSIAEDQRRRAGLAVAPAASQQAVERLGPVRPASGASAPTRWRSPPMVSTAARAGAAPAAAMDSRSTHSHLRRSGTSPC